MGICYGAEAGSSVRGLEVQRLLQGGEEVLFRRQNPASSHCLGGYLRKGLFDPLALLVDQGGYPLPVEVTGYYHNETFRGSHLQGYSAGPVAHSDGVLRSDLLVRHGFKTRGRPGILHPVYPAQGQRPCSRWAAMKDRPAFVSSSAVLFVASCFLR